MKCPYRDFQDCIVEQCPSCNYEEIKRERIDGIKPAWMTYDQALKSGHAYWTTETTYKFISCKLVDNAVQPVPATKQEINNNTTVVASTRSSLISLF